MKRQAAAFLFCAGVFLTASLLYGQGVRATLRGNVADESGAVIPGARVTVANSGTNETRGVQTDASGEYVVPQLQPGEYSLTVEITGFKKEVRRGIVLETGQEARLNVVLKVGNVNETVEVTSEAPLIQSENMAMGNVVDHTKISQLPLNGRSYLALAQLQPNVFAPAQGSTLGFRGGFNVAGNSEIANNYILDGIDNNDETTNQPLHFPILDVVREFRVLTGTYSAEYGRQAGGQIIVTTRSGTNQYHGSLWEFHRNSPLDARNFFAQTCVKVTTDGKCVTKPSFRRNQYGGVVGGPIKHDKTFFLAGYEGQRRGNQAAGQAAVPTVAYKNGDFSALPVTIRDPFNGNQPFAGNRVPRERWSPQGAGLMALYPDPNLPGVGNNFSSSLTGRFRLDQFSGRVDHKITDKDNLYGSYEFADSTEFYPVSNPLCSARDFPGWGCDELQRTQHAVLVWTRVFGPRLVNEARVGYTRFGFFRLQQDRDKDVISRLGIKGLTDAGKTPFNNGAPEIQFTGFSTLGGPTNLPQGRHDNTYHYVENMTFVQGSHTMKWGLDIRRFLFNSFFTSFGRGSFRFDGRFTRRRPDGTIETTNSTTAGAYAAADMLLGLTFQADRNLGEPFHNAMTFSSGYYFQDDWKVSPRLTLNLGLRYELNLPPVERVDKMASFDPRTCKLFDATQPCTLRVSSGREAYINPATGLLEIRSRADVGRRLWDTDKNNFAPRVGLAWRPFGGTSTVVRAGFGVFYNLQIVGNGITPLSRNSPFRQRQTSGPFANTARPNVADAFSGNPSIVPPGIAENFTTAYANQWSFGIQRELGRNFVLDVSYLGSESHKLPVPWNINQAFPGTTGTVNSRRPYQGYGSITGGFISSIGNANFHSMSIRAERRFSKGLSLISSYTWSKSIDDNAGISTGSDSSGNAQDARNLRPERGLSDFDVNHRWVFSYVYDLPFGKGMRYAPSNRVLGVIVGGWQINGILTLQGGRPFTVVTGTDVSNTGGNNDRPNVVGDWHVASPGPGQWFNQAAFVAAASNTFGNAGRNILRGDQLKNFDVGVSRNFRITERQRLQFRAEFFNLANHPFFSFPVASLSNGAFGKVQKAADLSTTGAQRQIQFGLKYSF